MTACLLLTLRTYHLLNKSFDKPDNPCGVLSVTVINAVVSGVLFWLAFGSFPLVDTDETLAELFADKDHKHYSLIITLATVTAMSVVLSLFCLLKIAYLLHINTQRSSYDPLLLTFIVSVRCLELAAAIIIGVSASEEDDKYLVIAAVVVFVTSFSESLYLWMIKESPSQVHLVRSLLAGFIRLFVFVTCAVATMVKLLLDSHGMRLKPKTSEKSFVPLSLFLALGNISVAVSGIMLILIFSKKQTFRQQQQSACLMESVNSGAMPGPAPPLL